MGPDILTARLAGVLFITATVVRLLATSFLNPVLNSSDYLFKVFANQARESWERSFSWWPLLRVSALPFRCIEL
jgi:hypothetical protein